VFTEPHLNTRRARRIRDSYANRGVVEGLHNIAGLHREFSGSECLDEAM